MTPSMEVRRFWDGAVLRVTPKDMKRTVIRDSSMRVTEAALQETSLRLIEPPAILMVVRGMILARRVPIAWTTAPVTINQDMKALIPMKGVKAEFLARSLDSAQEAFIPLIDEAGHGTRLDYPRSDGATLPSQYRLKTNRLQSFGSLMKRHTRSLPLLTAPNAKSPSSANTAPAWSPTRSPASSTWVMS